MHLQLGHMIDLSLLVVRQLVWLQVVELPELPPNGRYVNHTNECFDWGTFGWALETQEIDIAAYKYFIFLNSSVRGPFLPPYIKARFPLCCHLCIAGALPCQTCVDAVIARAELQRCNSS